MTGDGLLRALIKNGIYQIMPLEKATAQVIIVEQHYLHRRASCSFAWGLYRETVLCGVIMYGSPVSSTLCRGICGPDEARNVIELTRLWVADDVPQNGESFLIGNTLKLVPKNIVVSFADPAAHHVGTIYQATNALYTGLGPPRKKWVSLEHPNKHFHRGSTQGMTYDILRQTPGVAYVPAVQKHRYIWFTGSKRRRKELLLKLRYPVLPYPKGKTENAAAH